MSERLLGRHVGHCAHCHAGDSEKIFDSGLSRDADVFGRFVTGETILALHPASQKSLPGAVELGFNVPDLDKFHQEMKAKGVQFSMPPTKQDFGGLLAQFVDSEGAHCSVSAQ